MIYSLFSVSLKLKTPSEEGKKTNFKVFEDDIFEAANEFNLKYNSWNKRIIITEIENNFFTVLLLIEKYKDKISTREIRTFTAYLNKEKNWGVFSRDSSKLFEGINFSNISIDKACDTISNIDITSKMYKSQKKDIEFLLEPKNQLTTKDNTEGKNEMPIDMYHDLDDEQTLATLNYLLKTMNIGINNREKQETILQIKDLLFKWI
jgi:hypothetical protein